MERDDFKQLRDLLLVHDMWYGDTAKSFTVEGVEIDEKDEDSAIDVIINFTPIDKQMHVVIITHEWPKDITELYFFTWYDNRAFEKFTKDGKDMTEEDYARLLLILKNAGFKFSYEELRADDKLKFTKGFGEYFYRRAN